MASKRGLILEIIIVVGVLALTVLAVHHSSATKPIVIPNPTPLPTPVPTPSPLPPETGWETYTSTYEGASFQYPPNWTFSQTKGQDPAIPTDYTVTLTSPTGLKVLYSDLVSGLGGTCNPGEPHVILTDLEPLTTSGATTTDPVFLVGYPSALALADKASWPAANAIVKDTGGCLFNPGIASKLHPGTTFSFGTAQTVRDTSTPVPAGMQTDVPTAKLILETFHY